MVLTTFNSLKFAFGGPQPEAAAYLSALGASLAASCSPERLLPTVLFVFSVASCVAGVIHLTVAANRWSRLAYSIPFKVIAGYNSSVGATILIAGAKVATGQPLSWAHLSPLKHAGPWLLLGPALLIGVAVSVTIRRFPSAKTPLNMAGLVLPSALFHGARIYLGLSLTDARDAGWMLASPNGAGPGSAPAGGPAVGHNRVVALWAAWDLTAVDYSAALAEVRQKRM